MAERDQEVDDAEQYLGNHHKFDSPSASRRMGGGHDEVQVDPKNFFDILRLKWRNFWIYLIKTEPVSETSFS